MNAHHGVQCWREGQVVRLRLSRPEKRNALTLMMLLKITESLKLHASDRALVLDAEGADFCAGADLGAMSGREDDDRSFSATLEACLERLNALEIPTLICIKGRVLGGGLGLLAACDTVVSDPLAVFALPEVRLGLAPAIVAPFLREKVGTSRLRHWFLRGSRWNVQEALTAGLIHEVCEAGEEGFEGFIHVWVQDILRGAPKALLFAKRLAKGLEPGGAASLDVLRRGPEAKEGLKAFFERRTPQWVDQQALPT